MPTYQPGIPTGDEELDTDYQNIQDNFTVANTVFGIDHVTFDSNVSQQGYHESIHYNPQSTTATDMPNNYTPSTQYPEGIPATVAGIGQLFSSQVNDGTNTDTGLYWLSGNGLQVAMTRNFSPSRGTNGYTFLPGGLILQWGINPVSPTHWPSGNQTLTFTAQVPANIAFPNACLIVLTTFTGASGSSGDIGIVSRSTTNFVWNFGGSASASYSGFQWVALGY